MSGSALYTHFTDSPRPDDAARIADTARIVGTLAIAGAPLDLDETVRAFLDGAVGDENPTSQDDAVKMITAYAEARTGRHVMAGDRERLKLAVALAWNRRDPVAIAEGEAIERQAAEHFAKRPRHALPMGVAS